MADEPEEYNASVELFREHEFPMLKGKSIFYPIYHVFDR